MVLDLFSALTILSLPHFLYAFVWTRAATFSRLVKRWLGGDPVSVFAFMASVLKVVQFGCFALWYMQHGAFVKLADIGVLRGVVGLVLIVAGQVLNYGIYRAIGKYGVYYGTRLGKKIPWYNGFPFTVVRDPQYVGSAMTILALLPLGYTPAHWEAGLGWLCLLWSSMYIPTALIEAHL